MTKEKIDNMYIYQNKNNSINFYEAYKHKKIKVIKNLKNDNRSLVQLVSINGKKYVLKVPREKNTRKWQRFLSLFRSSEAKREFKNLETIINSGFNSPKPYFALENCKFGIVIFSFLITEYVLGKEATIEHIDLVAKTLSDIHKSGVIHGDSQLSNFMIQDNSVIIIDAKFSKNIYGNFGKAYEFIYLEESCNLDLKNYYNKKNIYYKLALSLNKYLHWWGRTRKKLKNIFRKGKK